MPDAIRVFGGPRRAEVTGANRENREAKSFLRYGRWRRKNWEGLRVGRVTMFEPLVMDGGSVTVVQDAGTPRVEVVSKRNPVGESGQEMMACWSWSERARFRAREKISKARA